MNLTKLKLLMKKWTVNIPIYNFEIEILYDEDMQNMVNYISEAHFLSPTYEGSLSDYDALTWPINGSLIIITTTTTNKYVIVHECVHVVWSMFKSCGIDDEESFAYMLQYLYKQVMDKFND